MPQADKQYCPCSPVIPTPGPRRIGKDLTRPLTSESVRNGFVAWFSRLNTQKRNSTQ